MYVFKNVFKYVYIKKYLSFLWYPGILTTTSLLSEESCFAVQSQKGVAVYFSSKQLLPFWLFRAV